MVHRRKFPLKPSSLEPLRKMWSELHGIQQGVPYFGVDYNDLHEIMRRLDLMGWRITGRPLGRVLRESSAAGAEIVGAGVRRLVQIEQGGEIYYGSYWLLHGDSLVVDSPYGCATRRARGQSAAEAAQRILKTVVEEHLVQQDWLKARKSG